MLKQPQEVGLGYAYIQVIDKRNMLFLSVLSK